jgi:hypothetical protein
MRGQITDGIALGAFRSLRSGPRGAGEPWRSFVEIHGGDEDAAIGQLLLRVLQLEGRGGRSS